MRSLPNAPTKLIIPLVFSLTTTVSIVQTANASNINNVSFEDIAGNLSPNFNMEGFSLMPGMGFIDYNNDSWIDIYLVNGQGLPNALYRNNKDGTFTDVAISAGVADLGHSTGVAVGDINNDGLDDFYLAQTNNGTDGIDSFDGPDKIFLNNGDGTFSDITNNSGIDEGGFTTSVGFVDYDGDGDLDIWVGRMIDFDFFVQDANRTNPTTRSHLYRNNGDLTFTDVTEAVGAGVDFATWAVAAFDYDNDKDMDLFLGHEQGPISVLRNDGGYFNIVTESSGDVVNYGAWMGLAIGDYNNDGYQDIYASNLSDLEITRDPSRPPIIVPPRETWDIPWPTLFRNNGDGTFTDVGEEAGVKIPVEFSWGTMFADFNNDGWQDIYLAQNFAAVNAVVDAANGAGPGRIFINQQDGTFKDVSKASGGANMSDFGLGYLDARGAGTADLNKDGLIDFHVANASQFDFLPPFFPIENSGQPKLFLNTTHNNNRWLQLRLIGKGESNRNAVGARVDLIAKTYPYYQTQSINGGGSVYSANERLLHFGLSKARKASILITWPDGSRQLVKNLRANKRWTIVQDCHSRISERAYERALKRHAQRVRGCSLY